MRTKKEDIKRERPRYFKSRLEPILIGAGLGAIVVAANKLNGGLDFTKSNLFQPLFEGTVNYGELGRDMLLYSGIGAVMGHIHAAKYFLIDKYLDEQDKEK